MFISNNILVVFYSIWIGLSSSIVIIIIFVSSSIKSKGQDKRRYKRKNKREEDWGIELSMINESFVSTSLTVTHKHKTGVMLAAEEWQMRQKRLKLVLFFHYKSS